MLRGVRVPKEFWADVRGAWREIKAEKDRFTIRSEVDGERLLALCSSTLDGIESGGDYDSAEGRAWTRQTLARFVE